MHMNWILHPKQLVDQDDDTHYFALNSTLAYCLPLTVSNSRISYHREYKTIRFFSDQHILRWLTIGLALKFMIRSITHSQENHLSISESINEKIFHRKRVVWIIAHTVPLSVSLLKSLPSKS
uniref:Uncharacterized protein n=1 Tax=Glossina pallidipes TaxID=7398 RepID=A0A1A9ZHW0_GLOPL